MRLLKLWQITVDCEMPSSPDTLWVLLARFVSMAWSTTSEFTVWGLPDLAWLLRFLQPKQNFLNCLITLINWTITFHTLNSFLVSVTLWPSWISLMRLCCAFICVAFKSHMKWNNAWDVSTPTTTILATTAGIFHSLNCFSLHVIIEPQASSSKNVVKILIAPLI